MNAHMNVSGNAPVNAHINAPGNAHMNALYDYTSRNAISQYDFVYHANKKN